MNRYWVMRVRRRRVMIVTAVAAAAVVLAAVILLVSVFSNGGQGTVTPLRSPTDQVAGIPLYESLLPTDSGCRPGTLRQIKYVVIHETGNPVAGADAAAHSEYLQGGGDGTTSWHYTLDDHCIYQHIPDNEVAWHAGDRLEQDGGNLNGIGVELCVNADGNFEQTMQNGAQLTAYLLRQYGLGVENVRQHYDFSGKNCPQTIREAGRWQEFLQLVRSAMAA